MHKNMNFPDALAKRIQERADKEYRTFTGMVCALCEQALMPPPQMVEQPKKRASRYYSGPQLGRLYKDEVLRPAWHAVRDRALTIDGITTEQEFEEVFKYYVAGVMTDSEAASFRSLIDIYPWTEYAKREAVGVWNKDADRTPERLEHWKEVCAKQRAYLTMLPDRIQEQLDTEIKEYIPLDNHS